MAEGEDCFGGEEGGLEGGVEGRVEGGGGVAGDEDGGGRVGGGDGGVVCHGGREEDWRLCIVFGQRFRLENRELFER